MNKHNPAAYLPSYGLCGALSWDAQSRGTRAYIVQHGYKVMHTLDIGSDLRYDMTYHLQAENDTVDFVYALIMHPRYAVARKVQTAARGLLKMTAATEYQKDFAASVLAEQMGQIRVAQTYEERNGIIAHYYNDIYGSGKSYIPNPKEWLAKYKQHRAIIDARHAPAVAQALEAQRDLLATLKSMQAEVIATRTTVTPKPVTLSPQSLKD